MNSMNSHASGVMRTATGVVGVHTLCPWRGSWTRGLRDFGVLGSCKGRRRRVTLFQEGIVSKFTERRSLLASSMNLHKNGGRCPRDRLQAIGVEGRLAVVSPLRWARRRPWGLGALRGWEEGFVVPEPAPVCEPARRAMSARRSSLLGG